jgi:hypothetical protein
MGGADDDLGKLGFLDDDAKIDFSNFKVGKSKEKEQEVEEEVTSIFGKLTSAFKNFTGNKVLTASDIEPILQEFSNSLTNKNVSAEIA